MSSIKQTLLALLVGAMAWSGSLEAAKPIGSHQPSFDPASIAIRQWAAAPFWTPDAAQIDAEEALAEDATLAPSSPMPFVSITPCRVADTRAGFGFSGPYGPPNIAAGTSRSMPITGQCGIPAGALAVSFNVTVTNTLGAGFVLAYPTGGTPPDVSTINYVAGQTLANAAIIPLSVAGSATFVAGVSGTDLVLDVNGYYAPTGIVNSLNNLIGAVTLAGSANVTVAPSGNSLVVSAPFSATGPIGPTGPAGPAGPAGTSPAANEDGSAVVASPTAVNYVEPDATLVTASGTVADVAMSKYALLSGRSGGQVLNGGSGAGGNLELQSTSHATKGTIRVGPNFLVLPNGHLAVYGLTTPTLGFDCGTGASKGFGSTDVAGSVQIGSSPGTDCIVAFVAPYDSAPFCAMSTESLNPAISMHVSHSSITFSGTFTPGQTIRWVCLAAAP